MGGLGCSFHVAGEVLSCIEFLSLHNFLIQKCWVYLMFDRILIPACIRAIGRFGRLFLDLSISSTRSPFTCAVYRTHPSLRQGC
jgi:hypothetical protein